MRVFVYYHARNFIGKLAEKLNVKELHVEIWWE